jgi:uncharacterized protein YidB (DUF937 family)
MGILQDVLGSVLDGQQRGGGMQSGGSQSGLPGGLGGMLGGGGQGGLSPIMMALMALLTQQMSGRGGGLSGGMGGGLGDLLGGLTGGQVGGSGQIQQPDREEDHYKEADAGGIGSRGQFSGGHTGFDGLLERLERGGQGPKAQSWIGHGQNEPIAPHELQNALGDDTVDQLATQTGMPKGDLLSQLSNLLPGVIDRLTPNGRVPEQHERQGW